MQRILVVGRRVGYPQSSFLQSEEEGFDVATAADEALALSIARQERFDLVVLDLMAPNISGIDV